MQTITRQWLGKHLERFDSKMVVLSILNEIWKKSVVFAYERDISCYIFQNISHTKLISIHEKTHDIITIGYNITRY